MSARMPLGSKFSHCVHPWALAPILAGVNRLQRHGSVGIINVYAGFRWQDYAYLSMGIVNA
jgi:hypothetical protein